MAVFFPKMDTLRSNWRNFGSKIEFTAGRKGNSSPSWEIMRREFYTSSSMIDTHSLSSSPFLLQVFEKRNYSIKCNNVILEYLDKDKKGHAWFRRNLFTRYLYNKLETRAEKWSKKLLDFHSTLSRVFHCLFAFAARQIVNLRTPVTQGTIITL